MKLLFWLVSFLSNFIKIVTFFIHYVLIHYVLIHYVLIHYVLIHYVLIHYVLIHYVFIHYVLTHYVLLIFVRVELIVDWTISGVHWTNCRIIFLDDTKFVEKSYPNGSVLCIHL